MAEFRGDEAALDRAAALLRLGERRLSWIDELVLRKLADMALLSEAGAVRDGPELAERLGIGVIGWHAVRGQLLEEGLIRCAGRPGDGAELAVVLPGAAS